MGVKPGAVIIAGGRDPGGARQRALRAFQGRADVEVWQDGGLALAFLPKDGLHLHVSDRAACLLEGRLHAVAGREITDEDPRASARLLDAFMCEGERILPTLRGEFWALVWDRRRQRGLAIADQLATCSPYWARDGDATVVASEVPELLETLSSRPACDPLSIAHWLMLTGPRAGQTVFSGVRRLPAGEMLRLGGSDPALERYWQPVYRGRVEDPAAAARQLRERLELAVQRRRAPGASTGVLLSGGLDSSVVAAVTALRTPPRTYSAVFPEHPSVDESRFIDATIRELRAESTRILVRGGSVIAGALGYIGSWRVPPTSPNLFFWQPLLERAGADGIAVMLDGEGGDELFGFSPYLLADRIAHGRLLSAVALARRWPGEGGAPQPGLLWIRLRDAGLRGLVPARAHRRIRRLRGLEHHAPGWLSPPLAARWLAEEDSRFAWKEIDGPRWWALLVYLLTRGAGPSAVYEQARRRCAGAGIRASHPLVDLDVIELALQADPEIAFDPRFSRPLLREAVAGLLPDGVRLRPDKSNFDALFHQILAGPDLSAARCLLDPREAELGDLVDMRRLYEELMAPEPPRGAGALAQWALRVWRLVTAECWLRSAAQGKPAEDLLERLGLAQPQARFQRTGGSPS